MTSCSGCRENCSKSRGSARTDSNLQQFHHRKGTMMRKRLPKHWTSTCLKTNRSKKRRTRMRMMRAVITRTILRRQTTLWPISKTVAQAQRRQTTSNRSVASCVVVKSSNQTVVKTCLLRPSSRLSSNKSNNKVLWVPTQEEGLQLHQNLHTFVKRLVHPVFLVT